MVVSRKSDSKLIQGAKMNPLPPQHNHVQNQTIEHWTDEQIWGHRFHNEQTPWLVLLEFLTLFRSRWYDDSVHPLNEPREPGQHEKIHYGLPRAEHLRYLIFNNPYLQHIEETVTGNQKRWRHWRDTMVAAPFDDDLGYLQERFEDFSRFVRVVEFFQNTALEPHRQRRWTSRFIFPYGPDCLYTDAGPDRRRNGVGNPDRLFFARAGELLYLMLNRSQSGPQVAEALNHKLMQENNPWNQLARALQPDGIPPDPNPPPNTSVGYLPYAERPEYDALAEDWLALLQMEMPGASLLDPLMRITGLHLILYVLRRAQEELGETKEGHRLVLEVAPLRKTLLFDLSRETYDANRNLPKRALESNLEHSRSSEAWQRLHSSNAPVEAALDYLKQRFWWRPKPHLSGSSPDKIFEALKNSAIKRHGQHIGKVVPEWSYEIGLAARRRGVGTWYSPNDAFLKALVITTVHDREEYHRFLARLYERYGLIIGVTEAEHAYGHLPTDERVFVNNAARLEQRLRTLGLLHRLSDDCAYVQNPFKRDRQ